MIRVRKAGSQDIHRLIEIALCSVQASQWPRHAYEKLFTDAESGRLALVVEETRADGTSEVVGFIVARVISAEWEIENIAVSGPARRRGLGSRLMGEFLNHVRQSGGQNVFLEVRESNTAARNLYEKWGFLETGRRKTYYQDPQEDALILTFSFSSNVEKSLNPL